MNKSKLYATIFLFGLLLGCGLTLYIVSYESNKRVENAFFYGVDCGVEIGKNPKLTCYMVKEYDCIGMYTIKVKLETIENIEKGLLNYNNSNSNSNLK